MGIDIPIAAGEEGFHGGVSISLWRLAENLGVSEKAISAFTIRRQVIFFQSQAYTQHSR